MISGFQPCPFASTSVWPSPSSPFPPLLWPLPPPPCNNRHDTTRRATRAPPRQILARLWRHSSGGAIHKLATCSRLPPPDAAPGPHVIVAAGRNEAAIWDLSKGGPCKQVRCTNASEGVERVLLTFCSLVFSVALGRIGGC